MIYFHLLGMEGYLDLKMQRRRKNNISTKLVIIGPSKVIDGSIDGGR